MTGEECLFCHRQKAALTWEQNRHHLTIREANEQSPALAALKTSTAKDLADQVKFVMGNARRQRFLKTATDYGKLDLLSVAWSPPRNNEPGKLIAVRKSSLGRGPVGASCGWVSCDGRGPQGAVVFRRFPRLLCLPWQRAARASQQTPVGVLSPRRNDEPRVVTSICAQCHVRTGKSKSTGWPYPNNFVAGDNLFRDFLADLSDQALKPQNSADKHVLENVRDVVVFGKETVTCLSCHNIHGRSSKKHHLVAKSGLCLNCHTNAGPKRVVKPFSVHSETCGY